MIQCLACEVSAQFMTTRQIQRNECRTGFMNLALTSENDHPRVNLLQRCYRWTIDRDEQGCAFAKETEFLPNVARLRDEGFEPLAR